MKPVDFEKRLQSQPLRQIPSEWRKEILQSANQCAPLARRSEAKAARSSFLSTIISQLSTILWLKPAAWACLAAMWVVIFALQFTSHGVAQVAAVSRPQASTFFISLKDQQQTLVELIGNNQPDDMGQPRPAAPKPRSELRHRFRVV